MAAGNRAEIHEVLPKERAVEIADEARGRMTVTEASRASPLTAGVADQLRELAELRDQGLITDAEFEVKRAEMLARM